MPKVPVTGRDESSTMACTTAVLMMAANPGRKSSSTSVDVWVCGWQDCHAARSLMQPAVQASAIQRRVCGFHRVQSFCKHSVRLTCAAWHNRRRQRGDQQSLLKHSSCTCRLGCRLRGWQVSRPCKLRVVVVVCR